MSSNRRIVVAALAAACAAVVVVTLLRGLSPQLPLRLVQVAACSVVAVAVLGTVLGAVTRQMADYREPSDDDDFERLVQRSERLAAEHADVEPDDGDFSSREPADGRDPYDPQVFQQLVREALDELPDILLRALDHVAVVISDEGRRHRAYGLYQGDTVARDAGHDRIVIFRDTLLRDFGDDPDELRAEVTRTVRHELAHHLGADELGVRDLGL